MTNHFLLSNIPEFTINIHIVILIESRFWTNPTLALARQLEKSCMDQTEKNVSNNVGLKFLCQR